MSLLDFAKQRIKPTADQEKAFLAIDKFLKSNHKCFLLKGYAGTGKTTLTKTIAAYIIQQKLNPVLLAPTGRAARILNEKTGFEANTIHRGIYNFKELDEVEIKIAGKKQFKFRYRLLEPETNTSQIYLIDEASMISDKRSESDFFVFGSGVLLKDILQFLAIQNKAHHSKVIFIGDPAQLPPVSDPISGALSAKYLKEKYELETQEYVLTQVVRQAQESGILKTANYLRNRLLPEGNTANFAIDSSFSDIQILNPEEVSTQYQINNPELKVNETTIINFSNKSALEYNLLVREKFFNNRYQVQQGDLLMINQNNYSYEIPLYNGTMVKVLWVNPTPFLRRNLKSYNQNGEACKVDFKFREVLISVPTQFGNQEVRCLIIDDFLYSETPQLKYEEHIALYIDFKVRHPNLKPKTKPFTDALLTDRYFNALRVKYGYAITCHKAQGGEWKKVMVNFDLNLGKHSEAFNRWAYTAVTRAEKMLYLFNYQKTSPFSKLNFNCHYLAEETPAPNAGLTTFYQLPDNLEILYKQFDLLQEDFFKREKFKHLLAKASYFGYSIQNRKAHPYQEQYTFEKASQTATMVFWYNGKNHFTRTTILNRPHQNQEFSQKLLNDFNSSLTIHFKETGIEQPEVQSIEEKEQSKAVIFPAELQELSLLYDNLKSILKEKDIRIDAVDHGQNHEFYHFIREAEKAVIQFYYNGNMQFTQAMNIPKKCNSNRLLEDLEEAIQLL